MIREANMSDNFGFFLVAVAAAWLVIGLMLSLVMGRRGHDGFSWLVMGSLLGPLAIVLALNSSRHEELGPTVLDRAAHAQSAGTVDILVGHDGSPEAGAVLESAIELFGPRLGRLTLATVVPFDGVGGALLGSTAAELARFSKVPVLMVGPSTRET